MSVYVLVMHIDHHFAVLYDTQKLKYSVEMSEILVKKSGQVTLRNLSKCHDILFLSITTSFGVIFMFKCMSKIVSGNKADFDSDF